MGLLHDNGLKSVVLSAVSDFREIKARHKRLEDTNNHLSGYATDLLGDVRRAIVSLGGIQQIDNSLLKHLEV